jgi:hypothetical protein
MAVTDRAKNDEATHRLARNPNYPYRAGEIKEIIIERRLRAIRNIV